MLRIHDASLSRSRLSLLGICTAVPLLFTIGGCEQYNPGAHPPIYKLESTRPEQPRRWKEYCTRPSVGTDEGNRIFCEPLQEASVPTTLTGGVRVDEVPSGSSGGSEVIRLHTALFKAVHSVLWRRWDYKEDADMYGVNDYWASQYSAVKAENRAQGDCEDFALTLAEVLVRDYYVEKGGLQLVYCRLTGTGQDHIQLGFVGTSFVSDVRFSEVGLTPDCSPLAVMPLSSGVWVLR